jgi:hypothetical protein
MHNETISWLLPGVKATKKEITVALVTITCFSLDGKIESKRVYWDQASVLRQAGVLPKSLYCRSNTSEVTLPICGDVTTVFRGKSFLYQSIMISEILSETEKNY